MPSHMSSIGFAIESEDDFQEFASLAIARGQARQSAGGVYVQWAPGNGVELWAQGDLSQTFVGLNPHFSGPARMRVGLTRRITRADESSLDGAFYGWADPEPEPESGAYPFVFDAPDFDLHAGLRLPAVVEVQLAAFAHELEVYPDDAAFEASQPGDVKFAAESFIPSGLFPSDADEDFEAQAYAIISGHVMKSAEVTNPATQKTFWWVRLRTYGGEVDVVADPLLVSEPPAVGGVVRGSFWLSGQIVESAARRRSLWQRVTGK